MTGLDTNVLARLILQDDPSQSAAARNALATDCSPDAPGYVSLVCLIELVWVLHGSGFKRGELTRVLTGLRDAPDIRLEDAPRTHDAIRQYAAGGPGFADHLIASRHQAAATRQTLTFDRKASRLPGWVLLGTG